MKTIMFILLILSVGIINAQSFTEKSVFQVDMSIAIDIGETIDVEGISFPVFELRSGKNFVKAVSKAGKQYPVWIHEQTELIHKGFIVHITNKGKYCIYKLNKRNYPYAVWLDKS